MSDESDFIAWLSKRIPIHPQVALGIGDDAAVVSVLGGQLVVTTDLIAEGSHFESTTPPELIGRKAVGVNLSDLAAMAARPLAITVSLLLDRRHDQRFAELITEGMMALADQYQVPIVGGDTNTWDGGTAISVTAIGTMQGRGFWFRSGARPGDVILVTGTLGGSILEKHLTFVPRIHEALKLNADYDIHAGMDITDGLSLDLSRLIDASDCGAELDCEIIPISDAATQLSLRDGQSPLQHALSDGEDFELLLTASASEAERLLCDQPCGCQITAIGRIVADHGLWQVQPNGQRTLMPIEGYKHRFESGS